MFRYRRHGEEIIVLAVRWYISYRLSLRDLAEMLAERGLDVYPSTIWRWVQRFVPEFEKRWDRLRLRREQGLAPRLAIIEACMVRFRPIMMTTVAAILGTLPIALGAGMGSEARRPLGIAAVGGLVFSQLLTLYITPASYVAVEHMTARLRRTSQVPQN
jgi:hypothetical protein